MCVLAQISLINYPGKVSATLFFPGCNFRCGYCHNPELINTGKQIDENDYLSFIKKKRPYISGVCITGGEPLLSYDSVLFLAKSCKEMKLSVKLDTNGYFPKYLEKLLSLSLLDYIAMDIKSSQKKYSKVVGCDVDISKINKSVEIIKCSGVDYEFRSTVVPDFYDDKDAVSIGKWLNGSSKYVLQSFSNKQTTLNPAFRKITPYSPEKMARLKKILKPYFRTIELRYN